MNNDLIYGKNNLTNVVSCAANDGHLEIFREIDGVVTSEFVNSKYWILSNEKIKPDWTRLKGDLHYKFGKQFDSQEQYRKTKYFNKNRDLYSVGNPEENMLINRGITYFKDMNISDVSILSFDLETTSLNPRTPEAKILLISTTYRKQGKNVNRLFAYDEYESEGKMLEGFCNYVRDCNPSIIIGHNIFGFDLNYLRGRAEITETKLLLGRDGSEIKFNSWESKFRKEATQYIHYHGCRIYGREIVDTMFLAIKHDVASRKYESYGLKNIIKQECLEKTNRTFYDAGKIRDNYKDPVEWEKIKAYCNDDSDDALMLFDLTIKPFFFLARSIPKTFQGLMEGASGSQLNAMMVRAYLQQGHSIPKPSEKIKFEGAISLGNPGVYTNCVKWDVASLYPSIMLQYSIYDKNKDPKGYMLEILQTFTTERLKNKKLAKDTKDPYYDALQNAQKIVINSLYGFLGTKGINFNYPEGAALVTRTGREILEKTIEWATGSKPIYELEIVNGEDGDSENAEI